ncbi:MAG: hypothetical protein ABSG96_20620, partial [Terracidiphilus sp.]
MVRVNLALALWLFIGIGGAVAMAEPKGVYLEACTAPELDFTALPPSISSPHRNGHLLVLEVQNIGSTDCLLSYPAIGLLPRSDEGNSVLFTSNAEEPQEALGTKPLSPGEWAHFVVVWVERIAPETPCEEYSTLKLNLAFNNAGAIPEGPALEVRNLWMHSCSPVFVSPYRAGHFYGDVDLSQKWKRYWEPTKMPDLSFPGQILSSEIVRDSPQFRVHTQAARTMIGDNIQLRLNFSRGSDNGCTYRMLRRRESNGATLILLQNCPQDEVWDEQPAAGFVEPGITRLELRNRNLIPDNLGSVKYDILGQIRQDKNLVLARTSASFSVRDPTNPPKAVLVTDLAACTASQLRFTA